MAYQVFDDRNPAIVYSPGWQLVGSSKEYNKTTASAYLAGSTAKLTFRGITVAVYGTIGSKNANFSAPQSAYSIDGGPPYVFRPNQTDTPHYSAKFYQSGLLSDTEHTLNVTSLVNYGFLYLDYIVVVTTGVASSSSVSPSLTTSLTGNSSDIASSTIVSTSTVTPISGDSSSSRSVSVSATSFQSSDSSGVSGYSPTPNANVGATSSDESHHISTIAGATVGTALGILLLLAIIFFILRRQRRREIPAMSLWNPPSAYQRSNPMVSRSSTNVSSNPRSPSVVGNYPTSNCSIQDYSTNRSLFDQQRPLRAQLSPYSTLTPSRPHRDDFDQEAQPPRYPSGELPSYGQSPFTHPRGLALVS